MMHVHDPESNVSAISKHASGRDFDRYYYIDILDGNVYVASYSYQYDLIHRTRRLQLTGSRLGLDNPPLEGTPTAAIAPNVIDPTETVVVARGLYDRYFHWYHPKEGKWAPIPKFGEQLGYEFACNPVFVKRVDHLSVYSIGFGGRIYSHDMIFDKNAGPSKYYLWTPPSWDLQLAGSSMDGHIDGTPALQDYKDNMLIFVKEYRTGAIWYQCYVAENNEWLSNWQAVPNFNTNAAPATAVSGDRLFLFAKGLDKVLYVNSVNIDGLIQYSPDWQGWLAFSFFTFTAPTTMTADDGIHLYARGLDNRIYESIGTG